MTKSPNPNPPYQFVVKTPSRNVWPLDKPEQNEFEVADFSFFFLFTDLISFVLPITCIQNDYSWKAMSQGIWKRSQQNYLEKKKNSFFSLRSKITEHNRPLKWKELGSSPDYSLPLPNFTFWPNSPL